MFSTVAFCVMPHSVMCLDGRGDGRNEHIDKVVKGGREEAS